MYKKSIKKILAYNGDFSKLLGEVKHIPILNSNKKVYKHKTTTYRNLLILISILLCFIILLSVKMIFYSKI